MTADEIKELATLALNISYDYAHGNASEDLAISTKTALHAAIDEMAKDAARYRWLNSPANGRAAEFMCKYGITESKELDAAIDVEMEKQQ